MNANKLFELIKNPAELDKISITELTTLLERYPYFQTGHLLLAKKLQREKHYLFNIQLKKVSAYSSDRNLVYFYLSGDQQKVKVPSENKNQDFSKEQQAFTNQIKE